MKRLLCALIALMLLGSFACAETLRVGMECNYAPYNWTQTEASDEALPLAGGGYADGYDVRIAKRVAEELGYDIEIVKTEWDGLVPSLLSGNIDVIIAGMSPTAERMATIDFTDPYYESELVIVVRKDGAYAEATSLADFAGAKITGQLNTFHYTVIDQIPDVQKQTAMDTFPTMIVALNSASSTATSPSAPARRAPWPPTPTSRRGICRWAGFETDRRTPPSPSAWPRAAN